MASLYTVPLGKIEVIYNGWEEKSFAFTKEEKAEVKNRYNLTNGKPILLFVGRVDDRRKGLDILLQAFKIVTSETDAILVVAGSGNQKPYKDLSSGLSIANRVEFTGFVDDVTLRKLYSICDVYVCPSRLEGFGLTILDAMAAGKPVVATNAGGIPEVVEPGQNGFLVQSNDENELALAITHLLGDGLQAKTMGENNRKYSWEIAAHKTAVVYAQLANV